MDGNDSPGHLTDDKAAERMVSVKGLKDNWQKWSEKHQEHQKHNPFSHDARPVAVVSHRGHDDYGRPLRGSLTAQRGEDARTHVSREVRELCEVIKDIGVQGRNHGISVEFGKLFEHYVTISNKLVGILLRARKQKLVDFEGEMLWQGKDDHVVITLLQ
ncbi:actin-binding Rho-activating protein-like isoform X2 [Syngnathus scovelli]